MWALVFIVASIVLALAVIVGANVWALREPPASELDRSLTRLLDASADPPRPDQRPR